MMWKLFLIDIFLPFWFFRLHLHVIKGFQGSQKILVKYGHPKNGVKEAWNSWAKMQQKKEFMGWKWGLQKIKQRILGGQIPQKMKKWRNSHLVNSNQKLRICISKSALNHPKED